MARGIRTYADIPGFFVSLDERIFRALLTAQESQAPGHLLELGGYLGRSAVVIGEFTRPHERFVVIDLFGSAPLHSDHETASANAREAHDHYPGLRRSDFETNYRALHPSLPEIIEDSSQAASNVLPEHSVRFLHIDASHLYANVRQDLQNAKRLTSSNGIVVIDDIRAPHTPGVWAAAWEAVLNDNLIPIAVSPQKMYAVYNTDLVPTYQRAIQDLADESPELWLETQQVLGYNLLRIDTLTLPGLPALLREAVRQTRRRLRRD